MGIGEILGGAGSLLGGIFGLSSGNNDAGKKYLKQALAVWQKVQDPTFDFRNLTMDELKVLAEQSPETYQAIIPTEVRQILDSPEMRASQLGALGQIQDIGKQGGLALEDRLAAQEAQRAMAQQSQRNQASVLRNLAERGRLGGGDEIQARLLANQQAGELGRGMASDITRQALARRLGAIQSAAGLSGQIRGQDIGVSQANADITNRFNELAAGLQNQAAQYNAAARERAQGYNVQTRQRVGEQNVANKYNVNEGNLNRQNALQQQMFNNAAAKASGMSGAYGGLAQADYLQQAAKANNIQQLAAGAGKVAGGLFDVGAGTGLFGSALQGLTLDPAEYYRMKKAASTQNGGFGSIS